MDARASFYRHIVGGAAGDAAPLLARVALCLAYDSLTFNVPLHEVASAGRLRRSPMLVGLTELLLSRFVEDTLLEPSKRWSEQQASALIAVAGQPPKPFLKLASRDGMST